MRTESRSPRQRWIAAIALLAVGSAGTGARAADEVVVGAEIAAPPAEVWDLLTDFARWNQVFPGITHLEVAESAEHGARLRTTTRMAGYTVRYTLSVTLDAGARRLDCTLDRSDPSDVRALESSWRVAPAPGGRSRVELRVHSESGLAIPRFVERRFTERSARGSVEALAAAFPARPVVLAAAD